MSGINLFCNFYLLTKSPAKSSAGSGKTLEEVHEKPVEEVLEKPVNDGITQVRGRGRPKGSISKARVAPCIVDLKDFLSNYDQLCDDSEIPTNDDWCCNYELPVIEHKGRGRPIGSTKAKNINN